MPEQMEIAALSCAPFAMTIELDPGNIRVEIQDSRIGIPKESLSKLGEELFRAPNAREADIPGTGMGLSIVKHLVEQFDGRMEVQSEEGEGLVFRVYFPQS